MAGIGFELRKVVEQRGISGFFKASLAGTIIVAGPWLISILGISVIQQLFSRGMQELPGAFIAPVIYCYAFSLMLGGGFHYIFTRIISDYLYRNDQNAAFYYLLKMSVPVVVISLCIGLPLVLGLTLPVASPLLYKAGVLVLFTAVNLLWFIMLFISVLKWYMRILLSFILGMTVSVILLLLPGDRYGIGGAVFGFALGHLIICLSLLYLSGRAFKPQRRSDMKGIFSRYMKKYKFLFLTGFFYYLGIWADKVINWIMAGTTVPGTPFTVYEPYDITVYFANLSMIPGLVYFVVSSETDFYILLRKFLISLGKGRFCEFQRRKYTLIAKAMRSIKEQNIFQGLITLGLVISAPLLLTSVFGGNVALSVLRLTFTAVFFHLSYLTLINFLFYLEMYRRAFYATLVFFTVNTVVSVLAARISVSSLAGLGYLTGGIAGTLVSYIAFQASIRKMDRLVLAGLRY